MLMSKKVIVEDTFPPKFDNMIPEEVYWSDATEYGVYKTESHGLYIVRREHYFMTCPDDRDEILKYIDDHECEVHKSGKLYIGYTDTAACYPEDSIKNVAYTMKEAGVKKYKTEEVNSMLDAMDFITKNNLDFL